jgi:hypothetical protein
LIVSAVPASKRAGYVPNSLLGELEVRVEVDDDKLIRLIRRARSSKTRRSRAAHGALVVTVWPAGLNKPGYRSPFAQDKGDAHAE